MKIIPKIFSLIDPILPHKYPKQRYLKFSIIFLKGSRYTDSILINLIKWSYMGINRIPNNIGHWL